MAGTLGVILGRLVRKSGATVAGLVQGNAGTNITQSTLTSISYAVYRVDSPGIEVLTGSGSLAVSSVVFDTAQTTDPRYGLAGGYNFLATLPASCFQVAGAVHRVEITFTPVTGEVFLQLFQGATL